MSPTAAIIDSQSVKSAEKRGPAIGYSSGYDAGKKIKGKKRHILVDTRGLLMHAIVPPPRSEDRDGGALLMASLLRRLLFADQALCRRRLPGAGVPERDQTDFRARPRRDRQAIGSSHRLRRAAKRWIVERTFAWLGRCRRLAEDWECLNHKALAFLRLAPSAPCCEKLSQSRMMFSEIDS